MMRDKKIDDIIKNLEGFRHQIEELKKEDIEFDENNTNDRLRKLVGNHASINSSGTTPKMIYTVNDLAKMFQVTVRTIYNWKEQGRLSFVQIRSKTFVTSGQLEDFLKLNEVKSFKMKRSSL